MAKTGRKSKYYTHVLPKLTLVEGWRRDGLSDEQIRKNLNINIATLYRYKKQFCEFYEALKKGKEVIDYEVENALLKRALGYKYDEVTTETFDDGSEKTKVTTKEVIPDTTAQIFWLKNRRPDKWRDKQHIEADIGAKAEDPFDGLSVEELRRIVYEEDYEEEED